MKEWFLDTKFQAASRDRIAYCNAVIDRYMADGLRLTLRQLYYQLVSANQITNTERSYKNIGNLVSKARLAGLMDWDAIEDRVRQPRRAQEWESVQDLIETALGAFRLPRLNGQRQYVELWVEKDALAGVLEPIAWKYHIVLMVNRGYSSQSAMYESANRIQDAIGRYGCEDATILYLGDLDPSGEDMVRDIQDRMDMFGAGASVEKLALNIDQVRAFNLPPNPAKLSDTRSRAFIAQYGRESWEVDAIPPRELRAIIETELDSRLDMDLINDVILREKQLQQTLRKRVEEIP